MYNYSSVFQTFILGRVTGERAALGIGQRYILDERLVHHLHINVKYKASHDSQTYGLGTLYCPICFYVALLLLAVYII